MVFAGKDMVSASSNMVFPRKTAAVAGSIIVFTSKNMVFVCKTMGFADKTNALSDNFAYVSRISEYGLRVRFPNSRGVQ